MRNNKDRRVVKNKRSVKKCFIKLALTKPIGEITVTELCKLANIDRKTFYYHYGNTRDVLTEIFNDMGKRVQELLSQEKHPDVSDILKGLNEIMQDNLPLYQKISSDPSFAYWKTSCKDILKDELKRAYFGESKMTEMEFEISAEYLASGLIGIYTDWLAGNIDISLEELTKMSVQVITKENKILQ